nr:hypothetical protein [Tanacetum cinerariifolium]
MGLDFGGDYYPARFGWQGNFGQVNSETLPDANTEQSQVAVAYPVLNIQYGSESMRTEFIRSLGGAARPELYGSRALQGRVAGIRIRGLASNAAPASPMAMAKMADGAALNEV